MASIESAIISLDTSEKRIPGLPLVMPSLTPIVLKRSPTSPWAVTPRFTSSASPSRCMLQVLPSKPVEQIPTNGLRKSASDKPAPMSMACEAGRLSSWV